MDTISDVLQSMRLTGAVFLEAHFTAPWSIKAHVSPDDCTPFMPTPRQIIAYHLITAGRCMLLLDSGTTTDLKHGDLVILPRNNPHVLASAATVPPVSAEGLIRQDGDSSMAHITYGGGGASTQMICGFLGSATENLALTGMLPDILKLGADDWTAASWVESTFRFAIQESNNRHADSSAALSRMAELLFFEAVRRYFALHPESRTAAVAGMHDLLVGRALVLMHKRMYEHWTTESLARQIGLCRSSFAERFTRALGEPPMRYLAHRRLEQASLRLLQSSVAIARIAYESGYESEAAFNRAFRRMYGAPPAAWRRSKASGDQH
ncbi:MAG: AraC family transcriptional regulator [Candidimonas sp.]|nr:AraC family transcriptional regulator [Candidimonas sp.]